MRTNVYLYGNRDLMWQEGERLGLTGEALKMFSYACYEVKVTLEIGDGGEANIVAVDDRELK